MGLDRRDFMRRSAALATGWLALGRSALVAAEGEPAFRVSLAGWSLHRRHFEDGALPLLDFPRVAREEFDIEAIEVVNSMFPVPLYRTLERVRAAAEDHGVRILLIMCDGEGDLSSATTAERRQAVRNHHKWVDVATVLGCHSIRVNTGGAPGSAADIENCAASLRELADYAGEQGLNVLAENHGGLSSHPPSLLQVLERAGAPNLGTLPDFGNFPPETDRYAAIEALMTRAMAVSAKCHDFDESGEEAFTDFERMLRIVLDAGYRGYVGIEYEGDRMSEHDGIVACRDLLRRIAQRLSGT